MSNIDQASVPPAFVCPHFFISFFRESCLLNRRLGLLCCLLHHHQMKYCCLGRIHHVSCLLLKHPRLFHRHESLFLRASFLFLYFLFVWMMIRSILCWAARSIFSCSFVVAHVPAPYVIVGVTTASNRCNRCRSKWDWDGRFISTVLHLSTRLSSFLAFCSSRSLSPNRDNTHQPRGLYADVWVAHVLNVCTHTMCRDVDSHDRTLHRRQKIKSNTPKNMDADFFQKSAKTAGAASAVSAECRSNFFSLSLLLQKTMFNSQTRQ